MSLRQSPRRQLRNVHQLRRAFALFRERIPEHRIAEGACRADHARSRCGKLSRAHMAHAFALFLAEKHQPSARAATKTALMRARRFHKLSRQRRNSPRLLVNPAIPPQIAGIVEHNFFSGFGLGQLAANRARNSL